MRPLGTSGGPGPFELAKVLCQRVQVDFKQVAMISPDGRSIVYLEGGSSFAAEREMLHVAQLDARHGRSALHARVVSECVVESG